jgi:hypothetical protein
MSKACARCGGVERAYGGHCVACKREYERAWYAANKVKKLAWVARYAVSNPPDPAKAAANQQRYKEKYPERAKTSSALSYVRNKTSIRIRSAAWYRAHPEFVAAKQAKRRSSAIQATPAWANDFFIKEAYALARLRTKIFGFKWHVDHIVPLNSGTVCGLHVEHNLQVIPGSSNLVKSNRFWPHQP